jgi:DNA replication protein DnaC
MPAWKRSTPISQIETFTDSGIPVSYPDPLGSFLTWRRQLTSPNMPWWSDLKELTGDKDYWRFNKRDVVDAFYKKMGRENISGECPQCKGADKIDISVDKENYWTIRCICALTDWIRRKTWINFQIHSWLECTKFSTFDYSNEHPLVADELKDMYDKARNFSIDPQSWLILSGPVGIGKTHLLRATATSLGPIALYLTTRDLVQAILSKVQDPKGMPGGSLDEYVFSVSNAPILLLDDLGAEHIKSANSFVMSQLLSIIDYRYQNPTLFPTMITTNQTEKDFQSGLWERIGDRIIDRKHDFIISTAPSYRQGMKRSIEIGHPTV